MKSSLLLLILGGLFFARIHLLHQTGVFDYDSAKNLEVIQEVCMGSFDQIFHHASPTFYFTYALLYLFSPSFLHLEYLSAIINLAALFLLVNLTAKQFNWTFIEKCVALVFASLGFFMVASARYLSIEPLSLLLFVLLLTFHKQRQSIKPFWIWALVGFAFTINYKFLLLYPLLWIWMSYGKPLRTWLSNLLFGSLGIIFPVLIYSLCTRWFTGDGLAYLKELYGILVVRDFHPSPEGTTGWFQDPLFYIYYLIDFEWPLLICFLIILINWQGIQQGLKNPWFILLGLISLYFLVVMSILPKAPRGLLIAYPCLYLIACHAFFIFAKKAGRFACIALILLSIPFQLILLQKHLYRFSETRYSQVSKSLSASEIETLYVTANRMIYPFLDKKTQLKVLLQKKNLIEYGKKAAVLWDAHFQIAGITELEGVGERRSSIRQWRELSLCMPLLHLENCEYSGKTYKEAWETHKRFLDMPYHLKLYLLESR